ncbi:MAG: hypothetical protein A2513_04440 [Sulfurimonas sp. RIFOXYD12_FULL_33_39]|uniref:hypothetical protein n=1 Tax=unclassified Sulfurimonas TaxID=2623549 RepID=UPI0008D6532D|nr:MULTISPECIES: hypothetical protein [unclassified Sulfurimonas]OHE07110.1 MAG: hypothetical protein A3G74_03330 [Sulfurimonas sp. RIFCSPLOWO2_12_FULL_34_6]OHE09383.1 MAG: hypothetical protein A2513_04440 [Sulfurimonas sp. RIFOXYD12_FULL_33_39]OHE12835.1 MAG: hypothetical protein A2530_04365 [Sulfurimonas sp. RIFOXYD2_FULL_34_21]
MSTKEQLVADIENLLNTYEGIHKTDINPDILKFMDKNTLISIIDSLLNQKEYSKESDLEWLEKFKKYS